MTPTKRKAIFDRADGRCEYCHQPFVSIVTADFTVDHIIPMLLGGHKTDMENLAACCKTCNGNKGSKMPIQHPRTGMKFNEFFEFNFKSKTEKKNDEQDKLVAAVNELTAQLKKMRGEE